MRASKKNNKPTRNHTILIVSLCLTLYFSFHLVFSDRSYTRYVDLVEKKGVISFQLDQKYLKNHELESKVTKMRSTSIDADLLDERVKYVLGYGHSEDNVIIGVVTKGD